MKGHISDYNENNISEFESNIKNELSEIKYVISDQRSNVDNNEIYNKFENKLQFLINKK